MTSFLGITAANTEKSVHNDATSMTKSKQGSCLCILTHIAIYGEHHY